MEGYEKYQDHLVLVPVKKLVSLLQKCQVDDCPEHALPSNIVVSTKGKFTFSLNSIYFMVAS